jgi:hypothetical protein
MVANRSKVIAIAAGILTIAVKRLMEGQALGYVKGFRGCFQAKVEQIDTACNNNRNYE